MTKFTDFATLDKLSNIMGLVVRSGRAEAAPEMATNTGEQVAGIDSVNSIEDISDGEDSSAAMEIDPPFRSPVGSLPPADVDSAVMHSLSDCPCTDLCIVHGPNPSLNEVASSQDTLTRLEREMATAKLRRRRMRRATMSVWKRLRRISEKIEKLNKKSGRGMATGAMTKRGSLSRRRLFGEVVERKSTCPSSELEVHDSSAGSRQYLVCTMARFIPSVRHRLLFEGTTPLPDLWLSLEGRQCSSLRVSRINRNAEFALSACRGEVCIYMTPTLMIISRINNFDFCVLFRLCIDDIERTLMQTYVQSYITRSCDFVSRYNDSRHVLVRDAHSHIHVCTCVHSFVCQSMHAHECMHALHRLDPHSRLKPLANQN